MNSSRSSARSGIPKRIVVRVAKESQSFAKVHEDLDLDIAQAHIEATIDAYCDDKAAFKRAMATTEGVDAGAVANIILAFFGRL